MKKIILALFAMLLAMPVFAETEIRQAVLAKDIEDRNPYEAITGKQSCGNEENPALIDSADISKVYLWNRISNDEKRKVVHSWQQNSDGEWAEQANIKLRVGVSGGWRSWSSKNIDPTFHKGDWRVVISTEDALEDVLCIVHFSVQ